MVHETVDQDIKKILIERDITTLKQAFCKIMCAEIRNNGTRVFVPHRLFLQNRLQNDLGSCTQIQKESQNIDEQCNPSPREQLNSSN